MGRYTREDYQVKTCWACQRDHGARAVYCVDCGCRLDLSLERLSQRIRYRMDGLVTLYRSLPLWAKVALAPVVLTVLFVGLAAAIVFSLMDAIVRRFPRGGR